VYRERNAEPRNHSVRTGRCGWNMSETCLRGLVAEGAPASGRPRAIARAAKGSADDSGGARQGRDEWLGEASNYTVTHRAGADQRQWRRSTQAIPRRGHRRRAGARAGGKCASSGVPLSREANSGAKGLCEFAPWREPSYC
jgi:hypothetical protein